LKKTVPTSPVIDRRLVVTLPLWP